MRHSNILVLSILWFSLIYSQENTLSLIIEDDNGNTDMHNFSVNSKDELNRSMEGFVLDYHKQGYLFASLNCSKVERVIDQSGQLLSFWTVKNLTKTLIDTVVAIGELNMTPRIYHKIFRPLVFKPASNSIIEKTKRLIKYYSFFIMEEDPFFVVYKDEKIALVVPIKERIQNSFMGAVGYLPRKRETPQVTGDIQIHLENVFKTASIANLWWQRKDEQSQILSLSYEEPFIWRFNFGGRFSFYQNLQDGLYVKRTTGLSVVKPYSRTGKWYIGGEKTNVTATPTGDSLGIFDHSVQNVTIENEWERRNAPINPSKGFYFRWNFEGGDFKSTNIKREILYRVETRWEILKKVFSRYVFSVSGFGGFAYITGGNELPESEMFRYGGATTLRGYYEQAFISDWVIVHQLELRIILQEKSRLYLFADGAIQTNVTPIPAGFGVGILQNTPLGILQLDYAIGRDDQLSNGKIHIRIIGEF